MKSPIDAVTADLFAEFMPEIVEPGITIADHRAWHKGLTHQERRDMVLSFKADNNAMTRNEIIFAIRRGESLHVRSARGEWLMTYYWSDDVPAMRNWVTGQSRTCDLAEIPSKLGNQRLNNENCNVKFYQSGEQLILRNH